MCFNHLKTIPSVPHIGPWKNCLPYSQSLVPKRMGTTVLKQSHTPVFEELFKYWLMVLILVTMP